MKTKCIEKNNSWSLDQQCQHVTGWEWGIQWIFLRIQGVNSQSRGPCGSSGDIDNGTQLSAPNPCVSSFRFSREKSLHCDSMQDRPDCSGARLPQFLMREQGDTHFLPVTEKGKVGSAGLPLTAGILSLQPTPPFLTKAPPGWPCTSSSWLHAEPEVAKGSAGQGLGSLQTP